MTREKIMLELFEFSAPTYYKWKKQDKRRIIDLLEYAFDENDLIEFIKTNKITKIEEIANSKYLLDLSLKFYKLLRHITNYKIAKIVLLILEKSYLENKEKIVIEKIAEDIYKNKKFYPYMKLASLNLIQKQESLVLEYICKNRSKIDNEFNKKGNRLIKKSDFLISNIA